MQFFSFEFLFGFLPIFLLLYYLSSSAGRKYILLAGSLFFYCAVCSFEPLFPAVAILLTAVTYLLGRLLEKHHSRWLLGISVVLPAATLIFFKLYHAGILLPVGLSFYVFQMIAYLAEIYKEKLPAVKNPVAYASQILMFPKILSGPIIDPNSLSAQFEKNRPNLRSLCLGLRKFIWGLSVKVLIADQLGGLWAEARITGYGNISTPMAWLALADYAMCLYFDFYGYSLMAGGLARMLGFVLPENFLDPYASRSVSEFYRRWHATLGAWFRTYIYIPLGGSRCSTFRTIFNLAVVWFVTGFWHGAGGNYLLWALFLCLLIILERLGIQKVLNRLPVLSHFYVIFVILLSWVPFAFGDVNQMLIFLGRLFGAGTAVNPGDYLFLVRPYIPLYICTALLCCPFVTRLIYKMQRISSCDVIWFGLFWVSVYFIATSAQNPFQYFRF